MEECAAKCYENRRCLYCVFAKLVKQNNIILSPDLADCICQHVVGHSARVDLVDWYSRSWYECIVYTRGVSIPMQWTATGDHFVYK